MTKAMVYRKQQMTGRNFIRAETNLAIDAPVDNDFTDIPANRMRGDLGNLGVFSGEVFGQDADRLRDDLRMVGNGKMGDNGSAYGVGVTPHYGWVGGSDGIPAAFAAALCRGIWPNGYQDR